MPNGTTTQVLQFSTVRVRQATKPLEMDTERKVSSLNVRRRNIARVRPSILDNWDSSRYPARGTVPFGASNIVARIQLDKLRVIGASCKVLLNRRGIPTQPIRAQLESSVYSPLRSRKTFGLTAGPRWIRHGQSTAIAL
jgi:hypothetical protein